MTKSSNEYERMNRMLEPASRLGLSAAAAIAGETLQ
jgi:hypothetical protein